MKKPVKKKLVLDKAVEFLKEERGGIRLMDLIRLVKDALPEVVENTVFTYVSNIEATRPGEVFKAARGLYKHACFKEASESEQVLPNEPAIKEENFYQPLADWLKGNLEECSKAVPLGGKAFKGKWGTPDVIGIKKHKPGDIIEFQPEVVSAEVKIDPTVQALLEAFGQACAYRLFSHKSYMVVPREAQEADLARLEALAYICGVGLILFNARSPTEPEFALRVRAAKSDPDMFYVNENLKAKEIADKLFG